MNKRQLEVAKHKLQEERKILKRLEKAYEEATQKIMDRIAALQAREQTQSVLYQLGYQQELLREITGNLTALKTHNYKTVQAYLHDCYDDGFIGSQYVLQEQGFPLLFARTRDEVVRAVETESKLNHGLYTRLAMDTWALQDDLTMELTIGTIRRSSYGEIARRVADRTGKDYKKIKTIVQTEGHRIQNAAAFDAITRAEESGAKIRKTWDATLDNRTRPTHRELDGQTVGVHEYFVSPSGAKALYPGGFGVADEDINCRCTVTETVDWIPDDYEMTKMDNLHGKLVTIKKGDYQAFKKKYFEEVGYAY